MPHNFTLSIKTGMQGFILLDRITHAGDDSIEGTRTFSQAPLFLGIEALAQLGAYHVRFLNDFKKHAFLLGIRQCSLHASEPLNGPCRLEGRLLNRSAAACAYFLEARQNGQALISGELLFATLAYDGHFQKEILELHYRKAFSCLQSDSKTS